MKNSLFLALLLICASCATLKKNKNISSGVVQYSLALEPHEDNTEMPVDALGTGATAEFNSNYLRLTKIPATPGEAFYLTDLQNGQETGYLELDDEGYAVVVEQRMLPPIGELSFHDSYKTIAGYRCQKATAPMGNGEMTIYFTKEIKANYAPYVKMEGFALEYSLVVPYGVLNVFRY